MRSTRARAASPSPSGRTPSARVTAALVIVIVLAAAIVYASRLDAPFILDDEDGIVRNPYIVSLWPLSSAMSAPAQSSFAGRPLPSLSLAASYAIGGLSPSTFRIFNIAVLIASGLVLAALVRLTLHRLEVEHADLLASAVALLWLLHPLNSEVVGYVTQRTESMMGLFYLLTLYAAARAMLAEQTERAWIVASVMAAAAGMASKESMVTAPLMVLLYDRVFVAGSFRVALSHRRWLYAGLAASWLVLIALNISAPRSGSAGFSTAITPLTYLLNQAGMIATYLKLSVWPSPLLIDYGRTETTSVGAALPWLVLVCALLALVAWAWLRHPHAAILGIWFFVTLAPTSSIVPIASEVGAERRMHLPLIAIIVLFVMGLRRVTAGARAAAAVAAAVAIVFGVTTSARLRAYGDPIGLWTGVLEQRPHGRAHYNLAVLLRAAGRVDEAVAHYRSALPGEPSAHYALGFEAAQAGVHEEAARELTEFLRLRPADPSAMSARLLLGEALTRLGKAADAERAFREALELSPEFADARGRLADLLLAQGRHAEAIAEYRAYLSAMPNSANAHHSLGLAFATSGREAEALPSFERAVELDGSQPQFRISFGTALASQGRLQPAIVQYRQALTLAPDDPYVMSALALALADAGEGDESFSLFRRALQIAPGDASIQSDSAAAAAMLRRR